MRELPGPNVKGCIHIAISNIEKDLFDIKKDLLKLIKTNRIYIAKQEFYEIWIHDKDKVVRKALLKYGIE